MRTMQRVIVATALGVPLLVAGQGLALASHHHSSHHGSPKANQHQKASNKIAPIAVSGDHVKLNLSPENDQTAAATNNNTNAEDDD